MKKTLTFLLVIAMLAMVSVTAFAVTNDGSAATGIEVNGEFVAADAPADKISVEIKWDEMKFTYTEAQKVWNPETHQYDQGDGTWSSEAKDITVSNHSNIGIKAAFTFNGNNGITGSFDNAELTLSTASGKTLSDTPSATSKFSVTGGKLTESGKLGTIEVIISKSDVQGITTEAALIAAIANGGTIEIGSDITLTDPKSILRISDTVEIDLCGHTLKDATGNTNMFEILPNGGNLTVKNGTLVSSAGAALFNCFGQLTVTNCTLMHNNWREIICVMVGLTPDDGSVVINNCTFNITMENFNEDETYAKVYDMITSSTTSVTLSGNIVADKGFSLADNASITVLAGTYNFDPTQYVDASTYNISNNGTTWTVTENKT